MKTCFRDALLVCILFSVCAYGQEFKKFERLRSKGDSLLQLKQYGIAAAFYEQALGLPEDQKPEIFGTIYYDLACMYSLNKEKEKALNKLEISFRMYNEKRKQNPVTASHISNDNDLDFVREEPRFKQLLKKYYKGIKTELLYEHELDYNQFLELLKYISAEADAGRSVYVRNKIIYWKKKEGGYVYNRDFLPLPDFEAIRDRSVVFKNCTFELNLIWSAFIKERQSFAYRGFDFEDCRFKGKFFLFDLDLKDVPNFKRCNFSKQLQMWLNTEEGYGLEIDSCRVVQVDIFINTKTENRYIITNNYSTDSADFRLHCSTAKAIRFVNNQFANKNVQLNLGVGETETLAIKRNEFNNMKLISTDVKAEFDFQRNTLHGKLLMIQTYFSDQPANDVDWGTLANNHLGLLIDNDDTWGSTPDEGIIDRSPVAKFTYNSGEKPTDISDEQSFNELMGLYSMFLNLYKNKNNLESYNQCYIAVKELQSKRLKYLYESNRTFENYFRWKLSRLLRFYVRYGTDPARAIVISLYIIFIFGVFFFFFPSDWDVTSKKRLIENFKDFIQKNEKGYVKPFFVLLWGFVISLINAVTLSLNAFITLGFGNIPTHGIARYFCVLEGFLGWFLLSIFTVALINQVL